MLFKWIQRLLCWSTRLQYLHCYSHSSVKILTGINKVIVRVNLKYCQWLWVRPSTSWSWFSGVIKETRYTIFHQKIRLQSTYLFYLHFRVQLEAFRVNCTAIPIQPHITTITPEESVKSQGCLFYSLSTEGRVLWFGHNCSNFTTIFKSMTGKILPQRWRQMIIARRCISLI
jgi:hypothetical protein